MSDFVFWNVVCAIAWVLWRILCWWLPSGTTFAVLSCSHSRLHGWIGTVLINDQKWKVFATRGLWRYTRDGKVLPEEFQDELRERQK